MAGLFLLEDASGQGCLAPGPAPDGSPRSANGSKKV